MVRGQTSGNKRWVEEVEVTAVLLCLCLAGRKFEGNVGEGHWYEDSEGDSESD